MLIQLPLIGLMRAGQPVARGDPPAVPAQAAAMLPPTNRRKSARESLSIFLIKAGNRQESS